MTVAWEHVETHHGMWVVTFTDVEGSYELTGPFPVQGVGSVVGINFYFRAKGCEWEFETNDEKGWLFPDDDIRSFQRRAKYRDANVMPHAEAAQIIADCVTEFLAQIRD